MCSVAAPVLLVTPAAAASQRHCEAFQARSYVCETAHSMCGLCPAFVMRLGLAWCIAMVPVQLATPVAAASRQHFEGLKARPHVYETANTPRHTAFVMLLLLLTCLSLQLNSWVCHSGAPSAGMVELSACGDLE